MGFVHGIEYRFEHDCAGWSEVSEHAGIEERHAAFY